MKVQTDYQREAGDTTKLILTCKLDKKQRTFSYAWNLTNHCEKRMAQRGFSYEHVLMAIEYGRMLFKQGLTFYVVTRRSLPEKLDPTLKNKLDNLVVVVSGDGAVITCYKSKNGIKHIRRKSNHLFIPKVFTKTEQSHNNIAA